HRLRRTGGCPDRKAVHGVSAERTGTEETETEHREQTRRPRAADAGSERPSHADRRGKDHESGGNEVGGLDPAERAVGQDAGGVAPQVEAVAGESLCEPDSHPERPGEYAVAE